MTKLVVVPVILCLFLVSVAANGNFSIVKTTPCDKEKAVGVLKEVRLTANCTERCILKPDSETNIEIDFDPGMETETLTPKLIIKLGPIEIPIGNLRKDVCSSIHTTEGKSCPLSKGTLYTYSRTIPIDSYYPSFPVSLKWMFLTDNNSTAICTLFKVIVAD